MILLAYLMICLLYGLKFSPGGELSSAFRTRRDSGVFATFVCKPVPEQYIIRMLQYVYTYGNFQRTSMVLFTICVMIILTPKQFPGLSVGYLQNSTQILNMIEISAV